MIGRCVLATAAVLLSCGVAIGADYNSFGYTMTKEPSGVFKLRVQTNAASKGMWLGLTVHPPDNPAKKEKNLAYPIAQGEAVTEFVIDPEFGNGTFEAAIWSKKLTGAECPRTDELCKKNGYKMEGMNSYIWGHVSAP